VAYKVVFLKGDERVGMTTWADKDRAIASATQDLPLRQRRVGATAAFVVDVKTSQVVFVLPASDGPRRQPT
jgi:hypothetical protein